MIPLLHFVNEFVDWEIPSDSCQKALGGPFIAVNVQEATDHLGRPYGIHPPNVDFDELNETILVEVKHEIMHEIETVAYNDQR